MKVYVVSNVRPDYQVFVDKQTAIDFAFKKADGRRRANVWLHTLDGPNDYKNCCLNPERNSDSHIEIVERELL